MNISRENTGELTAVVKIQLDPSDYQQTVDNQIADYKKKANIPGFRPGHVPTGLIKKMYGKALMIDEVNRLVSKELLEYIKNEELNILGNPIPSDEKNTPVDFDNQTSFEFFFDIGFAPEFTIPMELEDKVTYYQIQVTDKMIDDYIMDIRKRFGKPADTEPAEGVATGENEKEPAREPAEMTPEFFAAVYPGIKPETEEEFITQVKKDSEISFAGETDKLFFRNVTDALVGSTEMVLPDAFLKRWLAETNEDKYTPEEIEKDYPVFMESMKWQLIENKIIKEHGITVSEEEIRDYIRRYFFRQLNVLQDDPELQKRYESLIDTLMENKEQVQKINDQLYNQKLMEFFKSNLRYQTRSISYEDFIEILGQSHHHDHQHGAEHHDHDHHSDHHHDESHAPELTEEENKEKGTDNPQTKLNL